MQSVPEIIIAQQVYLHNGKRYVQGDNGKRFRGLILWKEVRQIVGKIHVFTGNCFYLDDHGFKLI